MKNDIETGKITVLDISEGKNNTFKIAFSNRFQGNLSKLFFPYFGLFKGKTCSKDEFIRIASFMRLKKEIIYTLSLIKKRAYSKNQIIEKLKNVKKLNYYDRNLILDFIKEEYEFKDSNSLENIVKELNDKNLSNSMIERKLLDKKFNPKMIRAFNTFIYEDEYKKALFVGERYLKKKGNYEQDEDVKASLYNYLTSKGFQFEIISDVMNNLFKIKLKGD